MAMADDASGEFQIVSFPIVGQYNVMRFKQFGPEDAANFYLVKADGTKSGTSMYPTFGRHHIKYLGVNQLIFPIEPRFIYRSINYWYAVVGNSIVRVDRFYNQVDITGSNFLSESGKVFFSYLVVNTITFACFTDDQKIYVYQEGSGSLQVVTDPKAPGNFTVNGKLTKPGYIATFGNRIVVSVAESSQFVLSITNLLTSDTTGAGVFDPLHCFDVGYNPTGPVAGAQVFAQENGIIRQMGVLNNTLYIFTDFTIGVWANSPAVFSGTNVYFPWKKNSTYDWNFGIADDLSLDIDFGHMVFLGQNKNGLLQVMATDGRQPERISSKAIDVLFQRYANAFPNGGPFLNGFANGFLYQYENTIFYRLSAGNYNDYGLLDIEDSANSIEYNFETQSWHRCIELNGERSRIQQHIFFGSDHLVTVAGESTVYKMSGDFYDNELRNPLQPDAQEDDAYLKYPFRYERTTPILAEDDQGEFETEYVQIDMVFGEGNISFSTVPFENTVFLIDETADPDTDEPVYLIDEESTPEPVYLIAEEGDTPGPSDTTYNAVFKPHIELYFSNNGGISFSPADVLQFSQMGQYQWRMRWYQLGCARNRVYKLVCVSPVPIVVLSGTMSVRRVGNRGN